MLKNCKGVTLLELITAIAIIGVLSSLAIPAFDNQMKNSRMVSSTNLVVGAYNMARSEAINRGVPVKVTDTAKGWNVVDAVTNEILNQFEPDQSGITWDPTVFPDVTYGPNGFRPFADSSVLTIKLTDDRGIGREITISASGSTSVVKIQ